MLEKNIEKIFRNEIRKLGGLCYKFVSPGNSGVPDRIVILESGEVLFVELKTEKGRPSSLQKSQKRRLEKHGQKVYFVYGISGVRSFLEKVKDGRLDLIEDEEK